MKSFVKRTVVFVLLIMLLPAMVLIADSKAQICYADSYYAELSDMFTRIKQIEGPRLIVIGGSNVAFGINGAMMEELLVQGGQEYTVCPFGLYGAVGSAAIIELVRGQLREGDLVVLAIEPDSETYSDYFGATAFLKCAETDKSLLLGLSADQRAAAAGNYLTYIQRRQEIQRSGELPQAEGAYRKDAFDERCDMVFKREGNVMAIGFDTGGMIDLGSVEIDPAFSERVASFCKTAEQRGAHVVLSFSPVNELALTDSSAETVDRFFSRIYESFPCTIISDPNTYIMESEWFFDSNVHLNTPGAQLRTYLLTADLLAYLGVYRSPAWERPSMPDPIVSEFISDETDGADYLFDPILVNGQTVGYTISGLSDQGRCKKELQLPSVHNGFPVLGFQAEVFRWNTALEELTVPESVEKLPDHCFEGCINLTRLVLLFRDHTCILEGEPFAGAASLRIYVPAASWHLYRDGVGCAENSWEPYLDLFITF